MGRQSSRAAFTLPELMVVISIIALLAALLFPVLTAAKARAKNTICAANLTSIHRAATLYMADADDLFPQGKDCLDVYAPVGYPPNGLARLRAMPLLSELLQPYAHSREIFRCPVDSGAAVSESAFPLPVPLEPTAFSAFGMSYEYHTALGMSAVSGSSLKGPAAVNLAEDLAGHWHGQGGITRPTDTQQAFSDRRWDYRYNVVYTDGHTHLTTYKGKEDAWREE